MLGVARVLGRALVVLACLLSSCRRGLPEGGAKGGQTGSVGVPGAAGSVGVTGVAGAGGVSGAAGAGAVGGANIDGGAPGGAGGAGIGGQPDGGIGTISLDGAPLYTRVQRLTNPQWERAVTDVLRFAAPANLSQGFSPPLAP